MTDAGDIGLAKNVTYALDNHWQTAELKQEARAELLKVAASTLSRWRSGSSAPDRKTVTKIARILKISEEMLYNTHTDFKRIASVQRLLMKEDYKSFTQFVSLFSTEKYKDLAPECAARYHGSYICYSRVMSRSGNSDKVAVWLLNVTSLTERGIAFTITNIDTRTREVGRQNIEYRYSGLMFPVSDCLYFVGDEESGNEPIAMITSTAPKFPPIMLAGYILAVGVTPTGRVPAGTKVALVFQSNEIKGPDELGVQLGVYPEMDVPEYILEHI